MSTVGTKFYYLSGATAIQIYGMIDKPSMRGIPAKLDWTSQEDTDELFIPGVRQHGDKNFKFKHATV